MRSSFIRQALLLALTASRGMETEYGEALFGVVVGHVSVFVWNDFGLWFFVRLIVR